MYRTANPGMTVRPPSLASRSGEQTQNFFQSNGITKANTTELVEEKETPRDQALPPPKAETEEPPGCRGHVLKKRRAPLSLPPYLLMDCEGGRRTGTDRNPNRLTDPFIVHSLGLGRMKPIKVLAQAKPANSRRATNRPESLLQTPPFTQWITLFSFNQQNGGERKERGLY
ncbi:hypothetical protein Salat_2979700 [Sesamum alatum]|uniref:Uncharacterized protein n=1 Tax=Sesamum alatum TaxID=300844 RepID=A0AAE2C7W2_9LAMI|nr:hypothetical protein Salat_2979700 [Sesamum alatum]